MTPGGMGLIEWTARGTELRRGWGHLGWQTPFGTGGNVPAFYADTIAAGDLVQLWLDYGYSRLDHQHVDRRHEAVAVSGVTQIRYFSTSEIWELEMQFVEDRRGADLVSDFAAIESAIDAWVAGTPLNWYPDAENYPTEYFACVLHKRAEPKRQHNLGWYQITLPLRVLPSVQMPSTVPPLA